ncbi:inositol monophosphatase family protein [Rhodanobacter aciditrophus]|uniref:Inositol monophosphatase family protein n=1 Tax=Rhodanobacter aciditrophus TaxID=1623218 RepID=A0ABW4B2F9_9GAMM
MLSVEQKEQIIEAIRHVAKLEILPRFRDLERSQIATKSGFDDLVTEADTAAEKALIERFSQIMPQAQIVGEESVSESKQVLDKVDSSDWVIIIDPIDGTWNYANGLSTFGVLVAVVHQGETKFGVLYDPLNDDWIEATKGEGCFYGDGGFKKPIKLNGQPINKRLVGFLSPFQFESIEQRRFAAGLQVSYGRTLSLRCCCHEYRTLAQGGVDFFVSPKPNVWDHAAGVLCYQEAGGFVKMLDGTPYAPSLREGTIVAARTPELLERVRHDLMEGGVVH